MRIYIAALYGRMLEMRTYAADLRAMGHVVTSRWVDGEEIGKSLDDAANMDLQDLAGAVCCLSFTQPEGSANTGGGRHTEFGLALAYDLMCVIVGDREQVFHHLPEVIHFPTWDEARTYFREHRS